MMTWYQALSFFLTNGLRIFLGLYLVGKLLELTGDIRKASIFSAGGAFIITMISCFNVRQFYLTGVETVVLLLIAHNLFGAKMRMCLFLSFFYEIAVALWEFILSAGLGIMFWSERFMDVKSPEYLAAVWGVRLLMLVIAVAAMKGQEGKNMQPTRIMVGVAIAGLFGVVFLSGQNVMIISDDILTAWIIFSMLILVAILLFNLNRQYEMEKTITRLEKEKNSLLERDYQTLRNTYAANAKLFHDFHNHMNALQRYLEKGDTAEATRYIENLCSPMQSVAQTVRTGDEAVDYLINSKMTLAVSQNIRVNTNIEFPRHTNIRSVDLVAILGNLLDNAFEAVAGLEESLRFISLKIRRINHMLVIKVENGCSVAPIVENGNIQTSKTDKTLHGWGLQSVRTAAGRYDGTIETEYRDHTFRAVVTLSFEAIKME